MNESSTGPPVANKATLIFNVCAAIFLTFVTVFLVIACFSVQAEHKEVWIVFVIGFAGFASGGLVGFVSASYGDEEERFANVRNIFSGLAAGFAAGDLTRDDSLIKQFLDSLAVAAGLDGNVGLVAAALGAYSAAGFMILYVDKRVLINPETARADQLIQSYAGSVQRGASEEEKKTDENATDLLLAYLLEDSGMRNEQNEARILDWMKINKVPVSINTFLESADFASERVQCADYLKLR